MQSRRDVRDEPRSAIASYDSYAEAERTVDYLSDQKFPVDRVSIVGKDMRSVEQVTGRLGYLGAAFQGAMSGATAGIFVGFLLSLFSLANPLVSGLSLAFYGLVFGAIVGAVFGLMGHALSRGRRDFSSVNRVEASRYDVMAEEDVAPDAARLLSKQS